MTSFSASIAQHGVIVPLVGRERKEGGIEIVAGVRRWRGAKQADLKTVPVFIREMTDDEALIAQAEENLQRADLHPMDAAEYFNELNTRGHDLAFIAKTFGLKKRDVQRSLKLCSLAARARGAFIKGTIDEDAALAIARVDLPAKQNEIISAVDAGTLTNEEVPGYVSRYFTAPLDDVPWRVSDALLSVKSGPCTTCPKRSSIQRDLFVEAPSGDRCMDIDCYRTKMDLTWAKAVETMESLGLEKHDVEAPLLFVPSSGGRPVVMKASGMVDAEVQCPFLVGHTWREAIARACETSARPPEYMARDQDGRPRYLYREAIAQRLVRKSDVGKAEEAAKDAADPVKPDHSPAKAEAKIRRAVIEQLSVMVVESTEVDSMAWITGRIIENATARAIAATVVQFKTEIAEVGVEGKDGLLAIASKSNRRARMVALAVMIRDEADVVGELSPSIRELVKLYDIDLVSIEKAIRE